MQRAATARTADRKRTVHNLAMISIGRTRVMNKQKKKEGEGAGWARWWCYRTRERALAGGGAKERGMEAGENRKEKGEE